MVINSCDVSCDVFSRSQISIDQIWTTPDPAKATPWLLFRRLHLYAFIPPALTTPSEAPERRSVRTSHRYEFRVSSIARSPPSRTRVPPSPEGEGGLWSGRGGSSAKCESEAGAPYSSYLRLVRTLLLTGAKTNKNSGPTKERDLVPKKPPVLPKRPRKHHQAPPPEPTCPLFFNFFRYPELAAGRRGAAPGMAPWKAGAPGVCDH